MYVSQDKINYLFSCLTVDCKNTLFKKQKFQISAVRRSVTEEQNPL